MKKLITVIALFPLLWMGTKAIAQQNVGVGTTTPDPKAKLDVVSTNQGVLVPRLTTTQRLAISTPPNSLLVFDTDSACFFFYNSGTSGWKSLCKTGTSGSGSVGPTGLNGSTGATGLNGANGATGSTGATGLNGSLGATGSNGITGSTGLNGSLGATGSNGITGATGTNGSAGVTGANGNTGATGSQGFPCWDTNQNGINDPSEDTDGNGFWNVNDCNAGVATPGPIGATGATGTKGFTGATGNNGSNGATGTNGTTGATGATGTNGFNGATGSSGVTGSTGPSGSGSTGATGTTGTNGFTGATGSSGVTGSTGPSGSGSTGATGTTGFTGATGASGTNGAIGATGAGTTGATGPTGADLGTHWKITGNAGTTPGSNYIGTSDAQDLAIGTNSTEKMRITSGGQLGLNTTSPNRMGNATDRTLTIESTSGANVEMIRITSASGAQIGSLNFDRIASANGTITGRTCITGQSVNGNDATSLQFHTMPAGGTLAPRMTITENGNVGIGTSAPAYNFVVDHGGNMQTAIGTTGSEWGMAFFDAGSLKADIFYSKLSSPPALVLKTYFADPMYFITNGAIRTTITAAGDVGIGTISPAYTLDVNGSARISAVTYFGSVGYMGTGGNTLVLAASSGASGLQIQHAASSTGFLYLNSTGQIGVGTNTPIAKLDVQGSGTTGATYGLGVKNGSGTYVLAVSDLASGSVLIGGPTYALDVSGLTRSTSGFWDASDVRFKKDIQPITSALSNVLKLQGVTYFMRKEEFKEYNFSKTLQYGLIAQDLEKVFPELVNTDAKGFKAVDYAKLTPLLIEAIKEQQKLIDNLQKENKNAASQISFLKAEYDARLKVLEAAAHISSIVPGK